MILFEYHFILNAFQAAYYHYHENENRDMLMIAYGHLLVGYIRTYQKTPIHSDIVEIIRSNIVQNFSDSNYELDKFLRSLPFSYDYLRKLFKKELGVTPHQYLTDKRLQAAADYLCVLEGADGSITEISRQCGFREPLYFSRMFKKKYGVAPSYYAAFKRQEKAAYARDPESVKIRAPGE